MMLCNFKQLPRKPRFLSTTPFSAGLLLAAAAALGLPTVGMAQTPLQYTITTAVGTGTQGYSGDNGPAASAELAGPFGINFDSSGNLYIADEINNRIRKVTSGTIATVVGTGENSYGGDGKSALDALLSHAEGITIDSSGNLYVSDTNNYVVREVKGGIINTIAGSQSAGDGYSGDGAAAISAQLSEVAATVLDSAGDVYIVDSSNNVIRLLTISTGFISTFAGFNALGEGYSGDGGPATSAQMNNPEGIAMDSAGNIYISDSGNHVIRKVGINGVITTIAGNGIQGFAGDGGSALDAEFNWPRGIALDSIGNLYVADSLNSRIRVITPGGTISTIAGTGAFGYSGDGGPADQAELYFPAGVAVDASNNVWVADNGNNVIRKLTPTVTGVPAIGTGGIISASGFGGGPGITPGGWLEIYGTNLAVDTRNWTSADFNGNNAPTSLDGTSVLIGGQSAYVAFISPGQVNVQVPFTVTNGPQEVTVTTPNGTSSVTMVTVSPTNPELLAPPSFDVGGTQYAAALFPSFTTYVAPTGLIPGINSQPAQPGDTIVLYGIGFGQVTPAIPAGQIVTQPNSLTRPVLFYIGGTLAPTTYAGLAPGAVGLYQFNIVVPAIPSFNAVGLTFTLGAIGGLQTLYTATQN